MHGAFVSDAEVHRVVEYLKAQGEPQYIDGILDSAEENGEKAVRRRGAATPEADPLYDQAVEIVLKTRRASISLVQRHLRIGYNRAARLIEQMERAGLVSAMQTNGNREVLAAGKGVVTRSRSRRVVDAALSVCRGTQPDGGRSRRLDAAKGLSRVHDPSGTVKFRQVVVAKLGSRRVAREFSIRRQLLLKRPFPAPGKISMDL